MVNDTRKKEAIQFAHVLGLSLCANPGANYTRIRIFIGTDKDWFSPDPIMQYTNRYGNWQRAQDFLNGYQEGFNRACAEHTHDAYEPLRGNI